jgi:hypothetical protein
MGRDMYPMSHAICAIWVDGAEPVDYGSDWYTMDMLKKAYEPVVYPMPGEEQWTKTNCELVDPPVVRIQPERLRLIGPKDQMSPGIKT